MHELLKWFNERCSITWYHTCYLVILLLTIPTFTKIRNRVCYVIKEFYLLIHLQKQCIAHFIYLPIKDACKFCNNYGKMLTEKFEPIPIAILKIYYPSIKYGYGLNIATEIFGTVL